MDALEEEMRDKEKNDKIENEKNRQPLREKYDATDPDVDWERKSDFSASFYGPLYSEQAEEESEVEVEPELADGYYTVKESHSKFPYIQGSEIDRIRYYILTKQDAKGRICLHRAAECGDKHFCTMICYEAEALQFTEEIVDMKDQDGLTPFYLLAEHGYRKAYDYDEDEENLMDGLGKTVVEEIAVDRENLKLDADGKPHPVKDMKTYENLDDFRGELVQSQIDRLLELGLYYTTRKPLVQLKDIECNKAGSRNYITKVLIEFGADPNI